jgi:hypothetical protein
MDQENKTPTGASSSDTTSALFVSARKKQLEQQETQRRAKEKEDQRLAAEAEVRRLEREVEERRRKAEEDARMAEAEAEQKRRQADEEARRIAEEARAKRDMAAQDPDSFLGAQQQTPKWQDKSSGTPLKSISIPPISKKLLMIVGGAVGAIVLVIILIIAISSGDSNGGVNVSDSLPSPTHTTPSPQPSPGSATSSIDVTATFFYLDGDEDGDSVWFYSNGTMVIYYSASGEEETHDYTIDGDTITVHGSLYNRQPFTFTIINQELLIDQDGDHFMGHAAEWTLDPSAYLDTFANIELLMLEIPFPGSQLYLESIFPASIMLHSMDDTASVSFQALYEFDWLHTEGALIEVMEGLLYSTFDIINEAAEVAIVLDDGYYNDPNITYAYFEILYEYDGETRFMHISVGGFPNLPVGAQWYYYIGVECLAEQCEEYMQLLDNIRYEMMRLYRS